jgi:hypothetical protein
MKLRKNLWLLYAGVGMLSCSLLAAPEAASGSGGNPPPPGPSPTFGPVSALQGELVRDGNLRLVVHGWSNIAALVFPEPESDQAIIAVDFSVVNAGSSALEVFSLRQTWAVLDSNGTAHSPDFSYSTISGINKEASEMQPGEKFHMALIYRMPDSSPPASLRFRDSRRSEGSISVVFNMEPGVAEPPEILEGEKPPAVLPMDASIQRGNWQVRLLSAGTSQPCLTDPLRSMYNCRAFPSDFLVVRVDLVMKNISGQPQTAYVGGMLWLQDPTGRRFYGSAEDVTAMGKSVGAGTELRFSADFLVWPGVSSLWLAFRDPYSGDSESDLYDCVALPPAGTG